MNSGFVRPESRFGSTREVGRRVDASVDVNGDHFRVLLQVLDLRLAIVSSALGPRVPVNVAHEVSRLAVAILRLVSVQAALGVRARLLQA